MSANPWVQNEIDVLTEMREKGYSSSKIAKALGRTPPSVIAKLNRLGLSERSQCFTRKDLGRGFTRDLTQAELDMRAKALSGLCRMPGCQVPTIGRYCETHAVSEFSKRADKYKHYSAVGLCKYF